MKYSYLTILSLLFAIFIFSSCKETKTSDPKEAIQEELTTLSEEEIMKYTDNGKLIAKTTFEALSRNLKSALTEGGVEEAAKYCNIVAMPLTDSLSNTLNASIKRTSTKLRNPENRASPEEMEVLNSYLAKIDNEVELKPMLKSHSDETVTFYAPIMIKPLCLTCHGTVGEELSNVNYNILKELYPEDKAIDYRENDLRGIWSIEMKKEI